MVADMFGLALCLNSIKVARDAFFFPCDDETPAEQVCV